MTIDLMDRIVSLDLHPHRGEQVLEQTQRLAAGFRAASASVIHLRSVRPSRVQPPGSDLATVLVGEGDLTLVKRSVGAFATSPLHEELRRLGVRRMVLAGIATNLGVESTARVASDLDYDVVVARDAVTALSEPEHDAAMTLSLPRFATLRTSLELLNELNSS